MNLNHWSFGILSYHNEGGTWENRFNSAWGLFFRIAEHASNVYFQFPFFVEQRALHSVESSWNFRLNFRRVERNGWKEPNNASAFYNPIVYCFGVNIMNIIFKWKHHFVIWSQYCLFPHKICIRGCVYRSSLLAQYFTFVVVFKLIDILPASFHHNLLSHRSFSRPLSCIVELTRL